MEDAVPLHDLVFVIASHGVMAATSSATSPSSPAALPSPCASSSSSSTFLDLPIRPTYSAPASFFTTRNGGGAPEVEADSAPASPARRLRRGPAFASPAPDLEDMDDDDDDEEEEEKRESEGDEVDEDEDEGAAGAAGPLTPPRSMSPGPKNSSSPASGSPIVAKTIVQFRRLAPKAVVAWLHQNNMRLSRATEKFVLRHEYTGLAIDTLHLSGEILPEGMTPEMRDELVTISRRIHDRFDSHPNTVCPVEGCQRRSCHIADTLEHVWSMHIVYKGFRCTVPSCTKRFASAKIVKRHFREVHVKEQASSSK